MNFDNRVCQKLHEEHAAVIALLERLTQTIARHRDDAPDAKDPMVAKLLSDLAAELPGEVERHFAFEEAELFPYLSEAGNKEIGAHLTYEHTIIRPIGAALVKLIGDVRAKGFDAARWDRVPSSWTATERLSGAARCKKKTWRCCQCLKTTWTPKPKPGSTRNTSRICEAFA